MHNDFTVRWMSPSDLKSSLIKYSNSNVLLVSYHSSQCCGSSALVQINGFLQGVKLEKPWVSSTFSSSTLNIACNFTTFSKLDC